MQLVILCEPDKKENHINELKNYKFRADVKIITTENNTAVIASAYAAIHLPSYEIMEIQGLNSIACGVPVISIDNDFWKPIYKETVLYASGDEKSVSEKMMILYKDEAIRNDLLAKGKILASDHTWETAAAMF